MATRELTLTVSLPAEVAELLAKGEIDAVSGFVGEAIQHQVRQAAIQSCLDGCEAAGHPPLTDGEVNEFRRMAGE